MWAFIHRNINRREFFQPPPSLTSPSQQIIYPIYMRYLHRVHTSLILICIHWFIFSLSFYGITEVLFGILRTLQYGKGWFQDYVSVLARSPYFRGPDYRGPTVYIWSENRFFTLYAWILWYTRLYWPMQASTIN